MRVVADTGPIHYLVLIGEIELLPCLFGRVVIPMAVRAELDRPATPPAVRTWIGAPPPWFSVQSEASPIDATLPAGLDDGERAAIALVLANRAALLLMDDRAGVAAARAAGIRVTGTLGILDRAARGGLVNLSAAFAALRATSFHATTTLMEAILRDHRARAGRR